MTNQDHYLIVGGGIGGLSVAKHLSDLNRKVTLIDRGINKSSIVAAGLINPLVFRRMTKSWRLDELLPYAKSFYQQVEQVTGSRFYHPITIRRFFSSEQEKGFWISKQDQTDFRNYMYPLSQEDLNFKDSGTKNEFGSARVKNAAWVNTATFLSELRTYLGKHCEVLITEFDYSLFNADTNVYKNQSYTHVIFCTGFENIHNPFFQQYPVQTTKGEVLTVKSGDLPQNESINRKCFVLPVGDQEFRIGATYVWDTPMDSVTEEGKKEILHKLEALGSFQLEVIDHRAGVRPTSPDRRPIIGQHPRFKDLYLFNGLGTKGYMIAPLLAKEFVDFLVNGKELDPETDLARFQK